MKKLTTLALGLLLAFGTQAENIYEIRVIDDRKQATKVEPFRYQTLVNFNVNQFELSATAKDKLRLAAKMYQGRKHKAKYGLKVQVIGRTDTSGSLKLNTELSTRRAVEAATYLTDNGVDVNDIYLSAVGPNSPALGERGSKNERNTQIIITERD